MGTLLNAWPAGLRGRRRHSTRWQKLATYRAELDHATLGWERSVPCLPSPVVRTGRHTPKKVLGL
jgi:hypothetical protein